MYQYKPERIAEIKEKIETCFSWDRPERAFYKLVDIQDYMLWHLDLSLLDTATLNRAIEDLANEKHLPTALKGNMRELCYFMPLFKGKPIIKQFCKNPKSRVIIDLPEVRDGRKASFRHND